MADRYCDGVLWRRVDELKPGDHCDLECDPIADPNHDNDELKYEWAIVESVERETDDCYLVVFMDGFSCGFPPDHEVEVDAEQTRH